jgi:DNA-binding NtrC family response regulator
LNRIVKETPDILVIDDDTGFLKTVNAILNSVGMAGPTLVSDGRQALERFKANPHKVAMIDLVMPGIDGMELLRQIKEGYPATECIIVTAIDEIESAVKAMKFGAYDYLVKPVTADKLVIVIKRALERWFLKQDRSLYEKKQQFSNLKNPQAFKEIVAADDSMARVFHQVEVVAPTDYSVVITGESGTGKELIARTIHALSPRFGQPFVSVNMGAVSSTLFNDEFFGHEKGAYTGAVKEKKGFLERAHTGTLFMDEITDLDLSSQGGLLRVLQEKEYYRLGSSKNRGTDIRIIAATNRNIDAEINSNRFRPDLFHRLNMFHINLLPLRQRQKDIIPLAEHFLALFALKNGKGINTLSTKACEALVSYNFPGNVRELANIIARAVLLEEGPVLTAGSLGKRFKTKEGFQPTCHPLKSLAQVEQEHMEAVLKAVKGNKTKAAAILKIGRRTLQRKLKN